MSVRDLDALLGSVRDPASRRLSEEVVRAYQAGAFRAAIISTWVAVALDLVGKLRELADDGDAGAIAEISELDSAIGAGEVSKLQKFENGLLDLARDKFELINGRDHLVLSRLMHDRHSCAHPAFVAPEDVFTPTAELARSHLVAAIDAVLQHPPTPGKRLVQRFLSEIGSSAWPSGHEDLTGYLRERYFGQQRESAKRQLAQLIVKCSLAVPAEAPNRARLLIRYPQCARALSEAAPMLFENAVIQVVRKREETTGLSEDEIRFGVGSLGDTTAFWEALPPVSRSRVTTCIRTSTTDHLVAAGVLATDPPHGGAGSDVDQLIAERIATADATELADALALRVSARLVEATVARVEQSGSWHTTNKLMPLLSALVQHLDVAQVQRLCRAAITNYEIYQAHTADSELRTLFDLTSSWPGTREDWITLGKFEHPHRDDGAAAFPEVRTAIASKWGAAALGV